MKGAHWSFRAKALCAVVAALLLTAGGPASGPDRDVVLPLDGFEDAIHHWQLKRGAEYPRHDPSDVSAIADNLLLMQRDHGGWVQNRDPLQIFSADDEAALLAEKAEPGGSFDNRNVFTQIEYLMGAYALTGDARYLSGAEAGLSYLLHNQFAGCGGWPHTVPAETAYQSRITVADEVFSGPLMLLRRISESKAPFDQFDAATKLRATEALGRAEACLLKLQVRQGGRLTSWAGQYDPETLAPMGGRSFELPAIVSQESAAILKYLMSIKNPSPEVIASVEGGVAWLSEVALTGVRLETVPLETEAEYKYHDATFDRRLTEDPNAPRLWARFYDLEDNSVVLANRDGIRVARFDEVLAERRTGYSWYGDWPEKLISRDYPKWRCRMRGLNPDGTPCT